MSWPRTTLAWSVLSELAEVGQGTSSRLVPAVGSAGPDIVIMERRGGGDRDREAVEEPRRCESGVMEHPGIRGEEIQQGQDLWMVKTREDSTLSWKGSD